VRRYKYLDYNPAQLVELESVPAPKAKYWNSKQAGAFLDAIVEERLYALFHLVVTRGLRRGEIVALRWEDLDLDDGLLEVCRSTVQIGYTTQDGAPKSGTSNRLIALDDDNVAVLKAHRARQQRERLALGAAYQDHGLVFARGRRNFAAALAATAGSQAKTSDAPAAIWLGFDSQGGLHRTWRRPVVRRPATRRSGRGW
jgi:integrase